LVAVDQVAADMAVVVEAEASYQEQLMLQQPIIQSLLVVEVAVFTVLVLPVMMVGIHQPLAPQQMVAAVAVHILQLMDVPEDLAEAPDMVIPLVVHPIKEIAAALLDTEMQVVLLLVPTKVQAVEVLVLPVLMHNLMS
jgi:hypothetical protein